MSCSLSLIFETAKLIAYEPAYLNLSRVYFCEYHMSEGQLYRSEIRTKIVQYLKSTKDTLALWIEQKGCGREQKYHGINHTLKNPIV